MRRGLVAGALALATALAGAPAAHAAAWVLSQNPAVSSDSNLKYETPAIAFDSGGDAVAAWSQHSLSPPGYDVLVSRRPAGGSWTPPQNLSANNSADPGPALAVAPDGSAAVVWSDVVGTGNIRIARAAPGAAFVVDPTPLATGGAQDTVTYPVVGVDGQDRITAAWARDNSFAVSTTVEARVETSPGTFGGTETVLGAAPTTLRLSLAEDAAGHTVIGYARQSGGWQAVASARNPGAGWSADNLDPLNTTTNGFVEPVVGIDSGGNATVVYNFNSALKTATWSPGSGTWGAITTITSGTAGPYEAPALVVTPAGDAQVVWLERTSASGPFIVKTAHRAGGTWTVESDLTNTGLGDASMPPALALSPDGSMTATYGLWDGIATTGVDASRRDPLGAWGAATALGNIPAQVTLNLTPPWASTDSQGNVIAAWSAAGAAIDGAGFDNAPPRVDSLQLPNATAGSSATFATSAFDVWGIGNVAWDFGDGVTGSGVTTTHTYSSAGTYTARATVTDLSGQTASASGPVTVAAGPGSTGTTTSPTPPPGNQLPPPVLGKTADVAVDAGTVLVKLPGTRVFIPLSQARSIPFGTIVDARRGRVSITIEGAPGAYSTADFYEGVFKITQLRRRAGKAIGLIELFGGSFARCPPTKKVRASAKKPKSIRHLWGSGSGPFRTQGRFSSATIRGTTWLTDDRCDGTLTRVTQGAVTVRDFVKRRSLVVKAPKSYLAKAPLTRKR